ncbi:glycoside hydrolase family 32 protein [Gracilibacillus sp. S3-1-1]|uniref:Glycoside hydrolase family 32 protein n=1 Tax=Gracilibacillus pellucidus TaxID=3095368 RepID=A0ACC6M3M1_9BACI|nr:glycoside hydrolase family 32 protein [Gracilibacillus sp. S3-1-1]MDX8045532.1 glycoside hydrolase family 32 protein [Gracilibacillus sp. S3-1-1]
MKSLNPEKKYRPYLHFVPKKNWMNDPNGLIYFKGEYHLFFQYNPNDSKWGPMHWGHAVSTDLITWTELPIALYPDEHGTIFSGSAVVDWNNTTGFFPDEPGIVAIFTHHFDNGVDNPPKQSQSLAYSHDNGRTWIKYGDNPVLEHDRKIDFRDPKVFWHKNTDKWIMVLATGQTVSIYSSVNLINWHFESEFGTDVGSHDGVWECPDLFELAVDNTNESKWMLIVSIGDNLHLDQGSRTQYFIGSFDGSRFHVEHETIKWLDYGKDNYAGVSFSDIPTTDGRRIYLGWMSNWRYANEVPTHGWRSEMTVPRELTLCKYDNSYYVVQQPVKELDQYFTTREKVINKQVSKEVRYAFDELYGMITLVLENQGATKYRLDIHHTESNVTSVIIDMEESVLTLDRSRSGVTSFSDNFSLHQKLPLLQTEQIELNILIDSSSIEIFVNGGELALTSLVYPDKTCKEISLHTFNGDVIIKEGYFSKPIS